MEGLSHQEVVPGSIAPVYKGWDGYNQSLVQAVAPLASSQLTFRSTAEIRSISEIALHIGDGRVNWFERINAPGSTELRLKIDARKPMPLTGKELADWLNETWQMVDVVLQNWTIDDLSKTYEQAYQGNLYAVSHQWTIWRIMAHDIHHGGQLTELLAMQGMLPDELTLLGGHITMPDIIRKLD